MKVVIVFEAFTGARERLRRPLPKRYEQVTMRPRSPTFAARCHWMSLGT